MYPAVPTALFLLQCFQVAFLALHDWVPLGKLTDTHAAHREDSRRRLFVVTLLSTAPFALLLWVTAQHLHTRLPRELVIWLAIAYGLLFLGEIRAWWLPYLRGGSPELTARYRATFGTTHAFLPPRHGITINTLHILLHAATLTTLLLLGLHALAR